MISSNALVETLAAENSTETESYLTRIYLSLRKLMLADLASRIFIEIFARPQMKRN